MTKVATIPCTHARCDRAFGSQAALDLHLLHIHADGRGAPLGFPCKVDLCAASFGSAANRDEHLRQVHRSPTARPVGLADFRCPDCDRRFDSKFALGPHRRAAHGFKAPSRAVAPKPKEQGPPKAFPCVITGCGASFDRAAQLGSHRFRAHGIRSEQRTPPRTGREVATHDVQADGSDSRPSDEAPKSAPGTTDGVATIVLSAGIAALLREWVTERGDTVDLDFTDPSALRREADRLELEQTLKALIST